MLFTHNPCFLIGIKCSAFRHDGEIRLGNFAGLSSLTAESKIGFYLV